MIRLPHTALTRWGKWTKVCVVINSAGLAFNYKKKTIIDDDPNYDDYIAELVDQALASMPQEMAQVDFSLKLKYVFERTNYEASLKLSVSEAQYKILLGKGQIWVHSYLTALSKQPDRPPELRLFFEDIEAQELIAKKREQ